MLIKDRLERAGLPWTMAGSQVVLDLRSVWIGGYWDVFQQQPIECGGADVSPKASSSLAKQTSPLPRDSQVVAPYG
jgi:hypothetical protein